MKLVRENLNEFERGDNSLKNLGIGKTVMIEKWFNDFGISKNRYKIDDKFNIWHRGDLDLSWCEIKNLPDNLTVDGNLNLKNCPDIYVLPNNLHVYGDLYLCGTSITSLPDDLFVRWGLDLSSTDFTSLPDNLTVNGWLDLRDSYITELPNNLTVKNTLWITNTKIKYLPKSLKAGAEIFKDF
jgi:hypothetical protein